MKRGAERQLTKDSTDDAEEVAESGPARGVQKAEDSVLASRPIRALPKRSALSASSAPSILATPAAAESEPSSPPKFSGFGGFGNFVVSSSGTTPFAFSAPKPSVPPPATSVFPPTAPASSSLFPSSSTSPVMSSSASNATKLFASVVDSSSKLETKLQNGSHRVDSDDERVKAETKYYTALRGLNAAFLAAATKATDTDPYTNLAEALESYKTLRSGVKADYEQSVKKAAEPEAPKPAPKMPIPPSSFTFGASSTDSGPKPSFISMPKPPSSFPFGGTPSEGFAPQSTSSPPASNASSNGSSSKVFSFADKAASVPDIGSASAGAKPVFTFPVSGSSSFTFGDSSNKIGSTTGSSLFGGNSSPSIFSSNLFNATPEDSTEKEAEKEKESKDNRSPAAASLFGGSAFGQSSEKPASSASGITFGTSSATRPSLFGGFGKPSSGSIGNPVGFGFGSPPKTPEAGTSSLFSGAAKPTAFSFGAPPKASESAEESGEGSEAPTSSQATPAPDDAPPLIQTGSVHDLDGEGEEDEETAHESRCKVYKMAKKDDGSSEWKDMGIGLLKLKVHKESGICRILLRNSGTGKITINFNVHGGMNPSVSKNVVSFMGHNDGVSIPFKLRVKTNEQADELKKILDQEVERVKAKS